MKFHPRMQALETLRRWCTMTALVLWQPQVLQVLVPVRARDQRGLSQSTENAILLAGAVTIAGVVITVVGKYVSDHLPK